jgi:hypothetical protein
VNLFERLRGRRDVDRDLADELAAHLDERIEELLRAGLSREAARRQARSELGNATLLTERGRDVWRFAIIEDAWQDLRYAARQLRGAPAFTATVILTLALGIGPNTVIFGAIDGLLIKTLTVTDPLSLVRLRYAGQNQMAMSRNDYGASARDPSGREVRATFTVACLSTDDRSTCRYSDRNATAGSSGDASEGFEQSASRIFRAQVGLITREIAADSRSHCALSDFSARRPAAVSV